QATHGTELVGDIVIFQRCEHFRVVSIHPRSYLRIGPLAPAELNQKERKRHEQQRRHNKQKYRQPKKVKKITHLPSKWCWSRRRQPDSPRSHLACDESLQHLTYLC